MSCTQGRVKPVLDKSICPVLSCGGRNCKEPGQIPGKMHQDRKKCFCQSDTYGMVPSGVLRPVAAFGRPGKRSNAVDYLLSSFSMIRPVRSGFPVFEFR